MFPIHICQKYDFIVPGKCIFLRKILNAWITVHSNGERMGEESYSIIFLSIRLSLFNMENEFIRIRLSDI